jgi:signal peptidase I
LGGSEEREKTLKTVWKSRDSPRGIPGGIKNMTNLRKKIITKILQKDQGNIHDFISKLKLFVRKLRKFAESIDGIRHCHPKSFCSYCNLIFFCDNILALEANGAESFLSCLRELNKIQKHLLILRKKSADARQLDLFLEEIGLLFRIVRRALWKIQVWDWFDSIIVAFLLAMIIRAFIVQAFRIPSGSMRMTLVEGDMILVNKFIYGAKIPFTNLRLPAIRQPKRADVIVFIYPEDKKKDFIKRLVGLPGETVEIKGGSIYINNKAASEAIFNQIYYFNKGDFGLADQKIIVPPENYFVLGDNSASSKDSRYWGFVPKDDILGQAMIIYWPLQRIRVIK